MQAHASFLICMLRRARCRDACSLRCMTLCSAEASGNHHPPAVAACDDKDDGTKVLPTQKRRPHGHFWKCGLWNVEKVVAALERGTWADSDVYSSLLHHCGQTRAASKGKLVHDHLDRISRSRESHIGNLLVDMYVKCGSLDDAFAVFERIIERNVFSWNIIIAGYTQNGYPSTALELFQRMQQEGVQPNQVTFVVVLRAFASLKGLARGKEIHARIAAAGFELDLTVGNALVNMYGKCGSMEDARCLFDRMECRNVVSWNGMIAVYAQNGHNKKALQILRQIDLEGVSATEATFVSALNACAGLGSLEQGKLIHKRIVGGGIVVETALVDMYAKCGSLYEARNIFNNMYSRSLVSWNAMIRAYIHNKQDEGAIELFHRMDLDGLKPDKTTYISVLDAYTSLKALAEGSLIHARLVADGLDSDVFVGNVLISMYSKCGSLKQAGSVYGKMEQRDVISWNAMIAGYAQNGHCSNALRLFEEMQQQSVGANEITFVAVLNACSDLVTGKAIHAAAEDKGFVSINVGNSLVRMYGKCGSLDDAKNVFDEMPTKNVVTWSTLIAVHAQYGYGREVLELFKSMQVEGITCNEITFLSILDACTSMLALVEGKTIHGLIVASGFGSALTMQTALLNMYSKCGDLEDATQVFHEMHQRDLVSWTSLIAAYAQHGRGKEALELFQELHQDGLKPDAVAFVSITSALSHAGLVEEACNCFACASMDFEVTPTVENYGCIIDLLRRAGNMEEAEEFIKEMPVSPNVFHVDVTLAT